LQAERERPRGRQREILRFNAELEKRSSGVPSGLKSAGKELEAFPIQSRTSARITEFHWAEVSCRGWTRTADVEIEPTLPVVGEPRLLSKFSACNHARIQIGRKRWPPMATLCICVRAVRTRDRAPWRAQSGRSPRRSKGLRFTSHSGKRQAEVVTGRQRPAISLACAQQRCRAKRAAVHARFPLETSAPCFYLPFTYSEHRFFPTPNQLQQRRACGKVG
jgi:hypothetical protein